MHFIDFPYCCTAQVLVNFAGAVFKDIEKPISKENLSSPQNFKQYCNSLSSALSSSRPHYAVFTAILTNNQRNAGWGIVLTEGAGFTEVFHGPKARGTEGHQNTGGLYVYCINSVDYVSCSSRLTEWCKKILKEDSPIDFNTKRSHKGPLSFEDILNFRDSVFLNRNECLLASNHKVYTTYQKYSNFKSRTTFFNMFNQTFGLPLPIENDSMSWSNYIQKVNDLANKAGVL